MSKPLTAAAVAKFRPAAERRVIRDGGARSLFLVVTPSGHKSWLMRFRRPDGKPAKIVLGPIDRSGRELSGDPQVGQPLSLVAARQLAAEIHRQRALGRDPIVWPPPQPPFAALYAMSMVPQRDPRFSADWAAALKEDNVGRAANEKQWDEEEAVRQAESRRAYAASLRR